MKYEEIEIKIAQQSGKCVEFGNSSNAPTPDAIAKVEERIGITLPESYKWFLANYAGGEVGGIEIFSIYENFSLSVPSGDISYMYLTILGNQLISSHEIPLMLSEFSEIFAFDSSQSFWGEYPVIRKTDSNELFADNFIEFLGKLIDIHSD